MDKVYKLTSAQAAQWTGVYDGEGFNPIEDANGNLVVGLQCSINEKYPFKDELALCPQIDFVPKVSEI